MTFDYAPSWKRLVSYIIDIIILGFVAKIILLPFEIPDVMMGWINWGMFFTYNILMEFKFGRTLGKMILKIRVIRINGQAPTLKTSVYRNVGKLVSALPLGWGFIRMLTPSFPQGIHDELARCYVVENAPMRHSSQHELSVSAG